MKEQYVEIQNILLKLFHYQKHLERMGRLPAKYDELTISFPAIEDQNQIYNLMKAKEGTQTNFLESKKFFYLPPLSEDPETIPIFSMNCDLDKSSSNVSFYIIVFRYPDDGGKLPSYIGFRFEGPEGEKGSTHHYWHMQPVDKFLGLHAKKFEKIYCWHPVQMPCIPIKAEGPAALLIYLLFSFYGDQLFNKFGVKPNRKYTRPLEDALRTGK